MPGVGVGLPQQSGLHAPVLPRHVRHLPVSTAVAARRSAFSTRVAATHAAARCAARPAARCAARAAALGAALATWSVQQRLRGRPLLRLRWHLRRRRPRFRVRNLPHRNRLRGLWLASILPSFAAANPASAVAAAFSTPVGATRAAALGAAWAAARCAALAAHNASFV